MINKIIKLVGILAIILGLLMGGYVIMKGKSDPNKIAQQTIEEIGKLMILPDEVPTLATVTDVGKLTSQKFFEKAENGDMVLIYQQAAKAILYRPKTNRIIDVTSVLETDQTNPSSTNAELAQTSMEVAKDLIRIALYNGTKTAGLTSKYDKKITDEFSNISIVSKEKAIGDDFIQTAVVDVRGTNKQLATDLAKLLDGVVVDLGPGDNQPDVDLMIIFGKNSI